MIKREMGDDAYRAAVERFCQRTSRGLMKIKYADAYVATQED